MKMKRLDQQPTVDPTLPKINNPELVRCPDCKCSYFEQVIVQQFPKLSTVVVGQATVPVGDVGFYIFRCAKCGEMFEPNVQLNTFDSVRKKYDEFMDELENETDGHK